LWPGDDPIGKCIGIRVDSPPCWTVVGVAEDIVQDDFDASKRLQFYVPIDQFEPAGGSTLLVKPQRGVVLEPEMLRASIQAVMPGAAYVTVQRLPDIVARARRSWKLGATMFGAFGVLALIVAGIGLYGTVAYNVAQRMHEMGVRIALGAESRDVIRLVVGQSATFAVAGVVTGLAAAFLAARWIQPLLFRQSATDPFIYAAVAGVMLVVSLLAAAVPAMRATRADPNRALRAE
jgi:ABC-type antimicrobial peptide transport system permease subunit